MQITLFILTLLLTFYGKMEAALNLATSTSISSDCSCEPNVTLGSSCSTYEIQLQALYLLPNSSNLNYAAEAYTIPHPTPHWTIHEIQPNYHLGFNLGLGYLFNETNTNLSLNWEHFDSEDSASTAVASRNNMVGPFFEIGPDAILYKKAMGKASFHFDQINLNYGMFVNFGKHLKTNLYYGINCVDINQTMSSTYSSADNNIVRSIKTPAKFIGLGPQLGFDFAYNVFSCCYVTGGTAGSILIGTQKDYTTYKSLSPALTIYDITPPNKQRTIVKLRTQIVPSFETRLGLNCAYTFCDHYTFSIEAGYEMQVYLNAIQTVDISSELVTPPVAPDTVGVFARTFNRILSNFSLAGPYLNLNLNF